jgi:hypothetical protein
MQNSIIIACISRQLHHVLRLPSDEEDWGAAGASTVAPLFSGGAHTPNPAKRPIHNGGCGWLHAQVIFSQKRNARVGTNFCGVVGFA